MVFLVIRTPNTVWHLGKRVVIDHESIASNFLLSHGGHLFDGDFEIEANRQRFLHLLKDTL